MQKKIDSLLPLIQKKEIQKWKGKWKLEQLRTNHFDYKCIEIMENKILFYDKSDLDIPSRIEDIKFVAYNPLEFIRYPFTLVFKNKEVWEFGAEKVKFEIRLFPYLKSSSDGRIYLSIDHRGIMKDPVKRKEALAREIRTYYALEEK
ncbi:hypothetical protein [Flavobacterium sp.]|uniref:hypothetical protein n=1 Tax=Flavobacterium sp. TaxID=239 RepID=UPI00286E1511|nr:hypothetical protein [Flavobacterium sp.]